MWAGRSTPPRSRTRSWPSTTRSMQAVLVLLCCTFLVVVDIEFVTSMSIDRLGIERSNELQSDKQTNLSEQKPSDSVVEDEELDAVPVGGETELYVLLPSVSKSERDSVDKNTIESDEVESSIGQENGSDMIMMESQDVPVMQVVNLPPSKAVQKESAVESKESAEDTVIKTKDEHEEKPTTSDEDDEEEPIKQVFKNDKDIEDMDEVENETDKDTETDSSEDVLPATQTGDVEKEAEDDEAPETMAELLADVVEEVEKEIESEFAGEETVEGGVKQNVKPKDEEQVKWEETVEKLEEKGSEKHKEQVAENEAVLEEAAAVLEQLMPEEAVEAMAMAEITDNSSEEKDESDKEKENEKENSQKHDEPTVSDGANKIDEEKPHSMESVKDKVGNTKEDETIEVAAEKLEEGIKNEEEKADETVAEEEPIKEPVSQEVVPNAEEHKVEEVIRDEEIKPVEETQLSDTLVAEDQQLAESSVVEDQKVEETAAVQNEKVEETSVVEDQELAETSVVEDDKIAETSVVDDQKLSDTLVAKPSSETTNTAEEMKLDENKEENDVKENEDEEIKTEDLNEETTIPEEHHEAQEVGEANGMSEASESHQADALVEESKPEHEAEETPNIPLTVQENNDSSQNLETDNETAETNETENEEIEPTVEPAKEIESIHLQESHEEAKPETLIMQADEQPTLVNMDEGYNENASSNSEPLSEISEEIKTNPMPTHTIDELINESETVNEEAEHNNEAATQPQKLHLEENSNENEQHQEDLLSPQLQPQKTEVPKPEPTNEKETGDMQDSTMLTTIIQTPSQEPPTQLAEEEETHVHKQEQEQEEHQQPEPQVEQQPPAITQQDEMHIQDDSKVQNEQIASEIVAAAQMTIASTTQAPQNVAISATQDSVLNYVNSTNALLSPASPSQQEQHKLQQQQPIKESGHGNEPEQQQDLPFSSQLRSYEGAQVWRIVVQSDRDRRLADELQTKYDGQLWKEVKQEVDYLLKPQVLADAEKHIRAANLSRIVLIDNLQKVIEVENPALDEFADADIEKGHRLTWHSYHRLADIHDFFDYLAKTYPEICAVETIGYSIEKRPLKVLKISNGNAGNPSVWIDGGMHAREWISPASVTYIANQIAEGWENLPSYMQNVNWYIHAVANPDGYEYTHTTDRLWRKNMRSHGRNCPGVDLNRNFGYKWGGKGTSANPCSQTYRGSKAFSEPETFYISKFISNFPRNTFHAFLSFHSYGQYILYPWGYDYTLTSDKSDLDRVARAAATIITRASGSKYTVGPSAVTLYPAAGGSDDWAKGIANIKYTYTVEMGDTGRYGFILPANQIESNGKDAYTFVQTVARAISHDMRKRTIKLK